MGKGSWYRVAATQADVRPLVERCKALPLAPGPWKARLTRCGLAGEIVVGSTDVLRAGLAFGDQHKSTQAVKGAETAALATALPVVELAFTVPNEGKVPLAGSLVMDRGKTPELIDEFRAQVIAKAPAGTTSAVVTAALTGVLPDIAIAVAVGCFVLAAEKILGSLFGDCTVVANAVDLVPTPGATGAVTLCLTELVNPSAINVGQKPGLADFGLSAEGFIETRRDELDVAPEALAAIEGYVKARRPYALLELIPG